jgi:hypothetical protein
MIDDRRVHDPLADGRRHRDAKDEECDEIEERGPEHGVMGAHRTGRHDRCDRVRGVVEAVHEIEREREHHEKNDDLEAHGSAIRVRPTFTRSRVRCPR